MTLPFDESRRRLLQRLTLGAVLVSLSSVASGAVLAADAPLVSTDDPTAKALKYVSDASKTPDAKAGSKCATCALYQGAADAPQGPCLLFPGKAVKATGWCSSWVKKA